VDRLRPPDLFELGLQPAVQLRPFDDPGYLTGDGAEEIDVRLVEVATLLGLDVDDADHPRARQDGDRKHRHQALLVDAAQPLETGLLSDIRHHQGLEVLGDPPGHPGADLEPRLAHGAGVQPVGGGQHDLFVVGVVQVQGADLDLHRAGGLVDDELQQGVGLDGRGCSLAQALQEEQLAERRLLGGVGHPNLVHEPSLVSRIAQTWFGQHKSERWICVTYPKDVLTGAAGLQLTIWAGRRSRRPHGPGTWMR